MSKFATVIPRQVIHGLVLPLPCYNKYLYLYQTLWEPICSIDQPVPRLVLGCIRGSPGSTLHSSRQLFSWAGMVTTPGTRHPHASAHSHHSTQIFFLYSGVYCFCRPYCPTDRGDRYFDNMLFICLSVSDHSVIGHDTGFLLIEMLGSSWSKAMLMKASRAFSLARPSFKKREGFSFKASPSPMGAFS